MPPRFKSSEETDRPPAMSGTPTAWRTLGLLALVITGWIFFKPVVCVAIKMGLTAAAWCHGGELHIDQLTLAEKGWIQAKGITWAFGSPAHRSLFKTDWAEVRPCSPKELLFVPNGEPRRLVREVRTGKTKMLLDIRKSAEKEQPALSDQARTLFSLKHATLFLPTSSVSLGPSDVVLIGEHQRLEMKDLILWLPDRWTGRITYAEGAVDIGSWHRVLPKAIAPASWEGGVLRIGDLDLGHEFVFRSLSVHPGYHGVDFGIRGNVGHGILRGDGTIGLEKNASHLELTLVGEDLALGSFREWMRDEKKATGAISQARFTFRGNLADPLNADCSLRLVARDFRWDGRGWDSLRLAAALTGRNFTLSELSLRQEENEVTASGQSHLPSDWHAVLRAPFSARFHAELEDAGTLAELVDPRMTQITGGLQLEGEIQGAENKASGYCNLAGNGMTISKLPLDWVKGCLIFSGDQTRLTSLEAWSGNDHLVLSGTVANSRPHDYKAEAEAEVRDLTKRLSQLGVVTAAAIGGGAVKFHWQGSGNTDKHSGTFQTQVEGWVSKWTTTGMSGKFQGSYGPGKVEFSKAEFKQGDLSLALMLSASTNSFQASNIIATRAGKPVPLVKGEAALPFNVPQFWKSGEILKNIAVDGPLSINLGLQGIKAEEIASLLGQEIPFVGTLEGSISAAGTITKPDLHAAVGIRNFSPARGGQTAYLTVSLDTADGKAKAKLLQQPASDSPLSVELEMPLRVNYEQGKLSFGNGDQPISGSATLQQVPLDGWASLLRLDPWPLSNARLDGKIQLAGTLQRPEPSGRLILTAEQMRLTGNQTLEHVSLPITLQATNALLGPGSVLYHQQPLNLSGTGDWGMAAWKGRVRIEGGNLPIPQAWGLSAHATTDMVLSVASGQSPVLSGTLGIRGLTGSSRINLTPSYAPPACEMFSSAEAAHLDLQGILKNLKMDIMVQTEGSIPLQPRESNEAMSEAGKQETRNSKAPATLLAVDVHARGPAEAPVITGSLALKNLELVLPCGIFPLTEGSIQFEETSTMLSCKPAFGMTKAGLCTVRLGGSLQHPAIDFQGPAGKNAPEMVMALTTPSNNKDERRVMLQEGAWVRQDQLFPMPCTDWSLARLGSYEPGALGFYGSPWIWTLSRD